MTNPIFNDDVQFAFDSLEHVFVRYKNAKAHESNRYPLGDPNRVEADLSEVDKAHLNLLHGKLQVAIARQNLSAMSESTKSSDRLGKKVFWLNVVVAVLSAVVAASSVLELSQ